MGKEEGTFVVFPFSFRVLSLLFWRGVNLASSLLGLPWGVGTGGVFGGWSPPCLGRSPSVGSAGFVKPLGCAVERSLESGPPQAGLSLYATLCVVLCAILLSTPLKDFAVERSLESGPPQAGLSLYATLCVVLCAILLSTPLEDFAVEQSLESGPPQAGFSLSAVLSFELCAGPGRVVPLSFAGECSLNSGPPVGWGI